MSRRGERGVRGGWSAQEGPGPVKTPNHAPASPRQARQTRAHGRSQARRVRAPSLDAAVRPHRRGMHARQDGERCRTHLDQLLGRGGSGPFGWVHHVSTLHDGM